MASVRMFKRETFKYFETLQFVEELATSVTCPKCKKILKDPLQLGCGHRFVSLLFQCRYVMINNDIDRP